MYGLEADKPLGMSGLEIISRESPDMMTGQIHFSSVTNRFWPVKLYKIKNSLKQEPMLYISKTVVALRAYSTLKDSLSITKQITAAK